MDELKQACNELSVIIKENLKVALVEKGRNMTGELSRSIDVYTKEIASGLYIYGEFLDYGAAQDQGITKDRIPYYPGSGNKKSKYIEGLTIFAIKKLGIPIDKAKGVAFAIARIHKKVGMHSQNKEAYPQGKGWVTDTLIELEPIMEKFINDGAYREFEIIINNLVQLAADKINKK